MVMTALFILILCIAHFSSFGKSNVADNQTLHPKQLSLNRSEETALRIMTFNIWLSGKQVNDGLKKIAKVRALIIST